MHPDLVELHLQSRGGFIFLAGETKKQGQSVENQTSLLFKTG